MNYCCEKFEEATEVECDFGSMYDGIQLIDEDSWRWFVMAEGRPLLFITHCPFCGKKLPAPPKKEE